VEGADRQGVGRGGERVMSAHRDLSAPIRRLALNPEEAAAAIGVSRAFFFAAVLPHLKVVRVGRKRLVPVPELEAWLAREATRISDG
jgi:hypothetical protein